MTILEVRQVTQTRKPFTCHGCHREFPVGSSKRRIRMIGDDGPYTCQWCQTCQGIAESLFAMDSTFRHEGVMDDDILESMQQTFGTWELADGKFGTITPPKWCACHLNNGLVCSNHRGATNHFCSVCGHEPECHETNKGFIGQ